MNIQGSISPKLWGPPAWKFLEAIAECYPEKPTMTQKKNYKDFFSLLGFVLPCEKCRHNYPNHLKILPLSNKTMSCKKNFVNWLNNVKEKTKQGNKNNNNNMKLYILIIITVVCLIYILNFDGLKKELLSFIK